MLKNAFATQPKREPPRKSSGHQLAPVVDFKMKSAAREEDEDGSGMTITKSAPFILPYSISVTSRKSRNKSSYLSVDPDWQFENEYDPMFPNEYDKALKELRERRDREAEEEEAKRKIEEDSEEKEDSEDSNKYSMVSTPPNRDKGVAIAPPPSLNIGYDDDERSPQIPAIGFGRGGLNKPFGGGASSFGLGPGAGAAAAAKIMAKYGYKEGQGLGRLEQGMSTALQVC